MTTSAPANAKQDRLRAHFNDHALTDHNKRWDDLWSAGDFLPWDRGYANPALIDTLKERTDLLPSPQRPGGKRARALVPGCGKGYDVALFSSYGYDSYGLEVSENAVKVAQEFLRNPGEGPLEGEYLPGVDKAKKGESKCLLGDFFEDEWLGETGGLGEGFDIIYDNTVSPAGYLHNRNPLTSMAVPLRTASLCAAPLGTAHGRAPRTGRRTRVPRVSDLQASSVWRTTVLATTRRTRRAVEAAGRGYILRRDREVFELRPIGKRQGAGEGCALEASADTPGGHHQRRGDGLGERVAAQVDSAPARNETRTNRRSSGFPE